MKLAIIGAGASGLVSLKYGIEEGHECHVYEETGIIGGVWVYRDETVDENDVPVSSPMYKDLITNLPKEVMTFLDFPYPPMKKSHIPQVQVLDYFSRFVNHFDLERYIKFYCPVTQVKPIDVERWSLTIYNTKTMTEEIEEYDAVFVCSGHFSVASLPKIPGQAAFKGIQVHSIFFRMANEYKNKRVLIVGSGSSGCDLARLISEVSDQVYISYRSELAFRIPKSVIKKPAISYFDETGAVFVDESKEHIDVVIYCTGYNYDFPFLVKECGIVIQNNWVRSLYKHIINIEHPTMYFIGIPQGVCVIPMFDLQARFALASLKHRFQLPTKEAMKNELDGYMEEKQKNGIPISHIHTLGPEKQESYFQDLAITAGIRPMPAVITNIFKLVRFNKDPTKSYEVVDDTHFTVTECQ